MDYPRFLEQLPTLYENWGQEGVCPKSNRFQNVLDQVQGMNTANVMQLLNSAVECMEAEEVYCEIGCFQGGSLIGALLEHPDRMAYAVDNFSEFDPWGNNFERLLENLSSFQLEERVCFCQQDFEDFFANLKEMKIEEKIGVYFYDGAHDYRSQLMGLLLAIPFLAEKAIIITTNSNWQAVKQATRDFMAVSNSSTISKYLSIVEFSDRVAWNGLQILYWDTHESNCFTTLSSKGQSNPSFIKALYDLQCEKQQIVESFYKEAIERDVSEQLAVGLAAGKTYSSEFFQQIRDDLLKAEESYKKVLLWDKDNVNAWLRLGRLYYVLERYQESLQMLHKSLEIDPAEAVGHYFLGTVLEKLGKTPQAIRAYQEAIALNPKFIDAYNNLGNLLFQAREIEQAELFYRQAIAANPEHFGSYLNLGNILMERQEVEKAIATYETALNLSPHNPDILYNLGVAHQSKNHISQAYLCFGDAFYYQEKYEEAIEEYKKILKNKAGDAEFYIGLAYCYISLNRPEEAIKVYRESLLLYPTEVKLYKRLVLVLQATGYNEEAQEVASEASLLLPDDLSLKLAKEMTLPVLYETQEEIDLYRRQFYQRLESLIQQTPLDTTEAINNALKGIGSHDNFYLQYQGYNDRELQTKYGQFVHRIMAAKYPQWVEPLPMPPLGQNGKIRIGYLGDSMCSPGIGKLYLGWLQNCDRQKFEVYCYYTHSVRDPLTHQFHISSDTFYQIPNDLEAICKQILADRLHILVIPAIGMNSLLTKIAGLRLAPVQCTTWAHPVTSGLPSIDYFLSNDLMEPENAQEHYCEQLIRLPNLGFSYPKQTVPEVTKTRLDFQLREDAVIYLSCQFLPKYLPQYDYIFPEIAQKIPSAQFAFVSSYASSHINTDRFWKRLQQAFAKLGLKIEDYCIIVPRQNRIGYLNLMLASDIFLDTFSYSGGITTLDAVACNLPVVTCAGELMRGRQSYGILKMLGVTETIAKNEAEYIEIAARLGLEPTWRDSIVQQMKQRHSHVYNDRVCIAALEKFYQRVVRERSVERSKLSVDFG
jgi:predicted O-linked N-acetylglucosamine transferase (SPINDLY family)